MSDDEYRTRAWARPECRRVADVLQRTEFGGPGPTGYPDDPAGRVAETDLAHFTVALCNRLNQTGSSRAAVEQAFIDEHRLSADPLWRPPFADRMITLVHTAYNGPGIRQALTVEQHAAATAVVELDLGSTSMVHRRLRVSFRRAVELMNELEQAGIVGPANGSRAREVLITADELAAIPTVTG